jgi:TPP-dependent pyruvate/acetoin dehydrogenase alpha subunit
MLPSATTPQERDPVERVRKLLIAHGYDSAALKTLEKAVKKEVDAAVEESKSAQTPPDDWLWRNVYVAAENTALRAVDGSMVTPKYDPTYAS